MVDGRYPGKAHVEFCSHEDAVAAMEKVTITLFFFALIIAEKKKHLKIHKIIYFVSEITFCTSKSNPYGLVLLFSK